MQLTSKRRRKTFNILISQHIYLSSVNVHLKEVKMKQIHVLCGRL
jgi:hypothetical protein